MSPQPSCQLFYSLDKQTKFLIKNLQEPASKIINTDDILLKITLLEQFSVEHKLCIFFALICAL